MDPFQSSFCQGFQDGLSCFHLEFVQGFVVQKSVGFPLSQHNGGCCGVHRLFAGAASQIQPKKSIATVFSQVECLHLQTDDFGVLLVDSLDNVMVVVAEIAIDSSLTGIEGVSCGVHSLEDISRYHMPFQVVEKLESSTNGIRSLRETRDLDSREWVSRDDRTRANLFSRVRKRRDFFESKWILSRRQQQSRS